MGASDYASLEERVNTILTGDENKRKVYLDGFDGHSFRAAYYFPDQVSDIHEQLERIDQVDESDLIQVTIGNQILCGKVGDLIVDSEGNKKPIEEFLR